MIKLVETFKRKKGLDKVIHYHPSFSIFCFGQAKNEELRHEQLFGCQIGSYPFRYLGIPMHYRKLRNKDWKKIEERIEKKISS
jgi:hypothetical protein